MISLKYDHFQIMGWFTEKFHQNPFKTVGEVEDKIVPMDRQIDGWTDRQLLLLLCCCFTSTVNSYGHAGTVSQPYHTLPKR